MNYIDFNTNPAGFPLEADAILGNMQTFLQDMVLALGQMMQLPAPSFGVVLSGCVVTGSTMTDGWILLNRAGTYEILFFEGGTTQPTYIISPSSVSKANQDGTSVPRIYTRKCVFGTGGTTYQLQDLYKFGGISEAFQGLAMLAKGGKTDWPNWVILYGLETVTGGSGGISAGVALYNGKLLDVAAYSSAVSSGSPVYLQSDGTWTTGTPVGVAITFNPYTDRYIRSFHRKTLHPVGSILWLKSGVTELTTYFPGTGAGIGEWTGWALANGNNSTNNLSAAISGLSAIQRMS
jgi:hypothetical protein